MSTPLPPLKPPQFSLRTLFALITLVACVSALANFVSPLAMAGIVFLIISIAAHIAGNKLGMRLREHASRHNPLRAEAPQPATITRSGDFVPPTRLRERKALGLFAAAITLLGTTLGAVLACVGTLVLRSHPSRADLIVFGLAGATMSGMFTFAAAGFVQEMLAAIWEASQPSMPKNNPAQDKSAAGSKSGSD